MEIMMEDLDRLCIGEAESEAKSCLEGDCLKWPFISSFLNESMAGKQQQTHYIAT